MIAYIDKIKLKGNYLQLENGELAEGVWLRGDKANLIFNKYKKGEKIIFEIPEFKVKQKLVIDKENYSENKILLKL